MKNTAYATESELRKIVRSQLTSESLLSESAPATPDTTPIGTLLAGTSTTQNVVDVSKLIGYYIAGSDLSASYGITKVWTPVSRTTTRLLGQTLKAGDSDTFQSNAAPYGLRGVTFSDLDPSDIVDYAINFIFLKLLEGKAVTFKLLTGMDATISPGSKMGAFIGAPGTPTQMAFYVGNEPGYIGVSQNLGLTPAPMNDASGRQRFIKFIKENPSYLAALTKPAQSPDNPDGGITIADGKLVYTSPAIALNIAKALDEALKSLMGKAYTVLEEFNTDEIKESVYKPLAMPGMWAAYAGSLSDSMFASPWRQTWGMLNMLSNALTQSKTRGIESIVAVAINLNNFISSGMTTTLSPVEFDTSFALNESIRKVMLTREQLTRVIQAALAIKTGTVLNEGVDDLLAGIRRAAGYTDEVPDAAPGRIATALKTADQVAASTEQQAQSLALAAQKLTGADQKITDLNLSEDLRKIITKLESLLGALGKQREFNSFSTKIAKIATSAGLNIKVTITSDALISAGAGFVIPLKDRPLLDAFLREASNFADELAKNGTASTDALDSARAALNKQNSTILPNLYKESGKLADSLAGKPSTTRPITARQVNQINVQVAKAINAIFGNSKLKITYSNNAIVIEHMKIPAPTVRGAPPPPATWAPVNLSDIQTLITQVTSGNTQQKQAALRSLEDNYGFVPIAGSTRTGAETAQQFIELYQETTKESYRLGVIDSAQGEIKRNKLGIILSTSTSTASAARASTMNLGVESRGVAIFKKATSIVTLDGALNSIGDYVKAYKDSLKTLKDGSQAKSARGKALMKLGALTVTSGVPIQTTTGRVVLAGVSGLADKLTKGGSDKLKAASSIDAYYAPRFVGYLIIAGLMAPLDIEKNPDNLLLSSLYETLMGSPLHPGGLGSAILFGGALAAKKITDDNMTSLIDSVITAQSSNAAGLTPAQEWVARVANPESAIKFLSDTLIRYQKEVTGNLTDSQLVTLFPGLSSGVTALPTDLSKMSDTIKKAAKSPGSIYDLVGSYIRSSNEKAAAAGPGESPDTAPDEQVLKAGAAALARDAAAIKADLAAISALAVDQTPLIVTKNLIPLQKNIIILTTYAARALQFNKNDIVAKQLDFNPVSVALSSTKTTMIKDYSRSFKLEDYPPELRNNILPNTVDDYLQLAGGDKALLPLAAHSIIQVSQGFSDDPVALTGLGMGVLKAHATEFGYDFTGDDISISTLQAIGRATDTAVVNFNDAWKASYTFGEASAEAVGAGPAQSAPQ